MQPFSSALVLVSAVFQLCGAAFILEPANFTMHYDQNGYPANNLTIACQPPADYPIQTVTFIQILRYPPSKVDPIQVAYLQQQINGNFPMRGQGLQGRQFRLSGEINSKVPQSSLLRVQISDASCMDAGSYECRINFLSEGSETTEVMSLLGELTVKTLPDQILIHPSPTYDSFVVDQVVQLHCSGQVGLPPAYFRWQYRNTGLGSKPESEFQTVTFGVTNNEGPYPQGFCRYFRTSILWVKLNLDLDGAEFRCLLVRDVTTFENSSASYTFKVGEAATCVPDCFNGGVCVENKCLCPPEYTGSFCENPVEQIRDKSSGSDIDHGGLFSLSAACDVTHGADHIMFIVFMMIANYMYFL